MKNAIEITRFFVSCLTVALLLSMACADTEEIRKTENTVKSDDWTYVPGGTNEGSQGISPLAPGNGIAIPTVGSSGTGGGTIGLSAGGAKDVNNFRANIANHYLPIASDITYEGVFYDYYFDTGQAIACQTLFCPSYVSTVSRDPLSQAQESFLSVGLNSGIKEADFARKRLNLMVVLDISGSMSSLFDSYYYDRAGQKVENNEDRTKSKLAIATESIVAMLSHLNTGDQFGMVLFSNSAYLAKPLALVEQTNMEAISRHILDLIATGGTNMEAGYQMALGMMTQLENPDPALFENRIVFLTDAMPNTGDVNGESLAGMVKKAADNRIFTTFIGIGVDFNSSLIELMTKTKGANYYSVHGSQEFKQRLDVEFDFMVTPLVFNLTLSLASSGYAIKSVYGSPEAEQATGQLILVNTLFPSKVDNSQTKGGVILALLEPTGVDSRIQLRANYEDRNSQPHESAVDFVYTPLLDQAPPNGIRKAILLTRYVRLLKAWIMAERQEAATNVGSASLGIWERQSMPLVVSDEYRAQFHLFADYFRTEMAAIGDATLAQEMVVLDKLAQ
jgi:Ca-activated chloride channel family protein